MDNETKKQEMQEKLKIRKKENKIVRRIVLIATLVILLIAGAIGVSVYFYVKSALEPVNPDATAEIEVEIPMGSGVSDIAEKLEQKEIVKSARIFKYYVKFKNASNFQAGNYKMTQSMTLDEIIESLKTGKVYREPVFTLTIPEGLTLDQIAAIVDKNTDYTSEQFMKLVESKDYVKKMMETYPQLITKEVKNKNIRYALEGYLYPATYSFYEEKPTLEEIVESMISQTNDELKAFYPVLEEMKMTTHELLTFASLLEEEATAQTDRETIASVFYNRIKADMPLQTDPTVLYSLGSHKEKVLYEDLEVEDPYNTYLNKGLPPGPIANAGKISIEAALYPTDTEYLYFLADSKGNNHFAKTYEEHLKNVDKYINN